MKSRFWMTLSLCLAGFVALLNTPLVETLKARLNTVEYDTVKAPNPPAPLPSSDSPFAAQIAAETPAPKPAEVDVAATQETTLTGFGDPMLPSQVATKDAARQTAPAPR